MLKKLRARLRAVRQRRKRNLKRSRVYALRAAANKRRARRLRRRIAAAKTGPGKAARWSLNQVGTVEQPPNSNRGPKIDAWAREWGEWLVGAPYCGIGVGCALKRASVQRLTYRVASVAYIEDDARAGRNGWQKLVPLADAKRGDAVILFGRGVHVELVISVDRERGQLVTVGWNTSPGTSGSQSNGGGVYRRVRPFGHVHVIARPNWP